MVPKRKYLHDQDENNPGQQHWGATASVCNTTAGNDFGAAAFPQPLRKRSINAALAVTAFWKNEFDEQMP